MKYYLSHAPANPVARVFAAVAAVLTLAVAVFFGLVVFLAIVGILAVLGVATWLRVWWLRRQMGRAFGADPSRQSERQSERQSGQTVIEAEYTVVSKRRD